MNNLDDENTLTVKEFKKIMRDESNRRRREWYDKQSDDKKKELSEKYNKTILCETCNCHIKSTSISHHRKSRKHIENWNKKNPENLLVYDEEKTRYNTVVRHEKSHCEICNMDFLKAHEKKHLQSKRHIRNLEKK